MYIGDRRNLFWKWVKCLQKLYIDKLVSTFNMEYLKQQKDTYSASTGYIHTGYVHKLQISEPAT